MEMGCYGIGITRIVAAAIEQNNDERGIIWTNAMAPFQAVIVSMNYKKSEAVREAVDKIYAELTAAGVDVLLDDRDEREREPMGRSTSGRLRAGPTAAR